MKGVIFLLFEEVVARDHGEDTWDALLDTSGLDGVFVSLGGYDDRDLFKLVRAAAEAWDMTPDEVVRWLGRNALPLFAERYPQLFAPHDTTRAFVRTLNDIIHPEVRKLFPGADVPEFDVGDRGPLLVMGYRSQRRMCSFAEGLLLGAADHFGEGAVIEQPSCMKRGDDHCVLEIAFT